MADLIEDFNRAHPGIHVTPIFAGGYDEALQQVQAEVRSGHPPDLAVLYSGILPVLRRLDAVASLDGYIARAGGEQFLADFFPAVMLNCRHEGRIWALPFQKSTMLLFYNKTLFQRAGLDPNSPPGRWDELVSAAVRLTVRQNGETVCWGLMLPEAGLPMILQGLVYQQGATLFDSSGSRVFLASPAAERAVQYLVDLSQRHRVIPADPVEWYEVASLFIAGKAAMMIHSTSSLAFVREQAGFPFGVAFLPKDGRFGVSVGGGDLFILKRAPVPHQNAAWTLAEWLTAPQQQARWCVGSGYVAVRRSAWAVEPLKSLVRDFPQAAVARDQLQYAGPELMTDEVEEVRRAMRQAIVEAVAGRQPVDAALQQAQAQADSVLARDR